MNNLSKYKHHVLLVLLAVVMAVTSCHHPAGLAFKSVKYISADDIDYTIEPSSGIPVDLGIDGIQYFEIVGPYLVVISPSEEGFFTVLDKNPPYDKLGSYFKRGRGPGELPAISLPRNYGVDDAGDLYADLDNLAGKMVRWNISESLDEGRTVTTDLGETGPNTFTVLNLGKDGIYYKELGPNKDSQQRYVVDNNSVKYVPENMRVLNDAVLQNKEDDGTRFNVLSTAVVYDNVSRRFAEASSGLNTIHLYSLDKGFARTYCIGDKIYDYNALADLDYAERPITTVDGKNNGIFASFLYLDVSMSAFVRAESIPRLILVPWDGSDILQIRLPAYATSFDIDVDSELLYCFNSFNETMRMYDIGQVLKLLGGSINSTPEAG